MRTLFKWLAATLLTVLFGVALLLMLAIDNSPRVARRDDVAPADVDRAVAAAKQHDPRTAPPGELQRLPLLERDVDLLAYYAARRWLKTDARVRLEPGRMVVDTSLAAPRGLWLNVELGLRQTGGLPAIDSLRVGSLPLPASLAWPLARAYAQRKGLRLDALVAVDLIERVDITSEQVTVSYRMGLDTVSRLRAAFAAPGELRRLQVYSERLAEVTRRVDRAEVSLADLLSPMLALAAERSKAPGSDAVAENRAALLTLTFFVNQRPLGQIVPAAYTWSAPRPLIVVLAQRHDSAQHFIISAVIAAESGTPLADAVGLWKEMSDSGKGGSGFSFNDLAADRAGTRFGELAARNPQRLQARMADGTSESSFMPRAADLPESLPEAEFKQRYGGIDGAEFKRMRAEIEARVDALPMFR